MRKATALLTGALAALLTFELASASQVAGYGVALVGSVALGTVLAAVRLWGAAACTADMRMATGLLAGLTLCGQVLTSTFGGPGLAPAHWTATAVAVVVMSLTVLVLVGFTGAAPQRTQRSEHPYAL
ncbi:hypothetical protein F0U44_16870 [Nocardioides humilatus]|uniref:Integral membrane protein n=1 Tax=Nocardioides humilatus TaxID=2607660 RepID=A0A5B1LAZ3_9ACTN|nr:hypothetical protein [Nocardioides humilatus]KAA1416859.1 hypothetical protein F0U44_16870 [Nocardioides humilatus]